MKTFRLWLEPDDQIPQFRRLAYELADVPIADVLLRGIHPWIEAEENSSLNVKLMEILNSDESKPPELRQFNLCSNLSCTALRYNYSPMPAFQENLERIKKNVYFIGDLGYGNLISIAKQRLRDRWCHRIARSMLGNVYGTFNSMRSFLKQKDKSLKLSGYCDFDKYDLGEILSLEDFQSEDGVVLSHGLPLTNFRSESSLGKVTDERGFLRLAGQIKYFKVVASWLDDKGSVGTVAYNCRLEGEKIRSFPDFKANLSSRRFAEAIANQIGMDGTRYCFTTDVPTLSGFIERKGVGVHFRDLDYRGQSHGSTSTAVLAQSQIDRFSIGYYVTAQDTGKTLRGILRRHGVSTAGNKDQLIVKLAKLAAKLYRKHRPEIDAYFQRHRFIRTENGQNPSGSRFPILGEVNLRNFLLAMYAVKHIRGNAILEAGHVNDMFGLEDLASALIKEEVDVKGIFLKVE